MSLRFLVPCLIVFAAVTPPAIFAQDDAKSEPPKRSTTGSIKSKRATVSFKNDVFPLIKKHCLPCHSEEQMNPSELYMDSYEGIMAGGKHGRPVAPGNAKESILIQKLSEKPPFDDRMPLKAKQPLSDEEMKVLVDWINQGAKKN